MAASDNEQLQALIRELNVIGMTQSSEVLEELHKSQDFHTCDRLDLLARIIDPEYFYRVNVRYASRLHSAHLAGSPEELSSCVDSKERLYKPEGIINSLASMTFIREGLNVCILGASDSGKSYLAKALAIQACRSFRVEYYCEEPLLENLEDLKEIDFAKFKKRMRHLIRLDLLILDDFLLHSPGSEEQIRILHQILNDRAEAEKSTIFCSQRFPMNWKAQIENDPISADAIIKRATKHYTVILQTPEDELNSRKKEDEAVGAAAGV